MKISYADYIKKTDVSVLIAEAIFSGLESTYPLKYISEVAATTSGGTPLRSNSDFYNGDIPWLKSGELNDGIIEKADEFITKKGLINSSAKLHPKNTLLLAMYGATAGRIGITKIEASTNQAVCALFPNEYVTQEYLFWFLRQHRYKFVEISKGGAQPNISQSIINRTQIPVPEKKLQKQISDLLTKIENEGTLDILIIPEEFRAKVNKVFTFKNNVFEIDSELTHQLSLVKKLRKQLLQDVVQGKLVEQNPKDEPGSELLKKIKEEKEQLIKEKKLKNGKELSAIKEEEIPFKIPESWIWCRLGEIGKITGGGTPSMANEKYWNGNIPWVSPKDMWSEFVYDTEMKVTDKAIIESATNRIPEGSLLIVARSGILKRKLPVAINKVVCTVNQDMKVLIPSITSMNRFLQLMLFGLENIILKEFVKFGMTVHSLKYDEFALMPIPLPPLPEQHRIVQKLDQLMQTCNDLEESIKQSTSQNGKLLQQVLREALEPGKEGVIV